MYAIRSYYEGRERSRPFLLRGGCGLRRRLQDRDDVGLAHRRAGGEVAFAVVDDAQGFLGVGLDHAAVEPKLGEPRRAADRLEESYNFV